MWFLGNGTIEIIHEKLEIFTYINVKLGWVCPGRRGGALLYQPYGEGKNKNCYNLWKRKTKPKASKYFDILLQTVENACSINISGQ